MIPLRDTIPSKSVPIVNYLLITVNLLVFLHESRMSETQLEIFTLHYGLVPANILPAISGNFSLTGLGILKTFITNTFIHGSLWHIVGNMWFLFIFGDNVEDKMGKFGYLIFYLLVGILASATHFVLYSHSNLPVIGASGAISGVMAAYVFLFPKSKIITLIPIFLILPLFVSIPAYIFIGIWFIIQLISGTGGLIHHGAATGIAFWAHIGGFVAGMILFRLFVRRKYLTYS